MASSSQSAAQKAASAQELSELDQLFMGQAIPWQKSAEAAARKKAKKARSPVTKTGTRNMKTAARSSSTKKRVHAASVSCPEIPAPPPSEVSPPLELPNADVLVRSMARGSLERLLPLTNIAEKEFGLTREAVIGATFAVVVENVVRAFRGRAVFPLRDVALAVISELEKLSLIAAPKPSDLYADICAELTSI